MITKFKIFENQEEEILPDVGDFVLVEVETFDKEFDEFINNTIFTVVKCWKDYEFQYNYEVRLKCDYVPKKFSIQFFEGNEIIYWVSLITEISKSKEHLEQFLAAKKYNI